jgi:hypothetical protein
MLNEAIEDFFDEWLDEPRAEFAYMTPLDAATQEPYDAFMGEFVDMIEEFITGVIPPDILKFDFDILREDLAVSPNGGAGE